MAIQANTLMYGLRVDGIFYPLTYWAIYQSPRAEDVMIDNSSIDWKLRTHSIRFDSIMYKDSFNKILELFRSRYYGKIICQAYDKELDTYFDICQGQYFGAYEMEGNGVDINMNIDLMEERKWTEQN